MTLPFDIPVLETERLTLRPPRESDFEAIFAFGQSERSSFSGKPFSRRDAWWVLMGGIGHWALRGYGYWSVDLRSDGTFVGRVGISFVADDPEPDFGWLVFDGFEGRGYAYEAALSARAHSDAHLQLGPLASAIEPHNARSRALALRLGAKLEETVEENGKTYEIYRHPWKKPLS